MNLYCLFELKPGLSYNLHEHWFGTWCMNYCDCVRARAVSIASVKVIDFHCEIKAFALLRIMYFTYQALKTLIVQFNSFPPTWIQLVNISAHSPFSNIANLLFWFTFFLVRIQMISLSILGIRQMIWLSNALVAPAPKENYSVR